MKTLKHIDVKIVLGNDDTTESIAALVKLVRVQWDQDLIEIQLMSGGFMNSVYKIYNKNNPEEAIVVRVFTSGTEAIKDAAETQLLGMRIAEAGGCGAEVIASFENGIIYEFAQGETLAPEKYDSNEYRRIVAHAIAKFHHMDIPANDLPKEPRIFSDMKTTFADFPEDFGTGRYQCSDEEFMTSKKAYLAECARVEEEIKKVKCDVVFSHGDLWWSNVVYNEKDGGITLIDYDLVGYNYLVHDLSRFLSVARLQLNPLSLGFLTEAEEKDFLKAYIDRRRELMGKDGETPDSAVEKLYGQCTLYKMILGFWGIGLTIQVDQRNPEAGIWKYAAPTTAPFLIRLRDDYLKYVKTKSIESFSFDDF